MLYLIPTPIGNLEDITLRALRTLKEVDYILAEDTRTTGHLMKHFEIKTPLRSYHAHNEHRAIQPIIEDLLAGKKIGVVSDAGTPGISDPAFLLTRACVQHQIKICCLPGPTALIPALVMSGLPCDTFHFEGFLPHKKGRSTRIKYLTALPNTFVLYESPFRLVKCLTEIMEAGGDRKAAVVREISKVFETCHSGTLSTLIAHFMATTPKGEIVVIVEGADNKKAKNE